MNSDFTILLVCCTILLAFYLLNIANKKINKKQEKFEVSVNGEEIDDLIGLDDEYVISLMPIPQSNIDHNKVYNKMSSCVLSYPNGTCPKMQKLTCGTTLRNLRKCYWK